MPLTPPKFKYFNVSKKKSPKKILSSSSEETNNLEYVQRIFKSPKLNKMGGSKKRRRTRKH